MNQKVIESRYKLDNSFDKVESELEQNKQLASALGNK